MVNAVEKVEVEARVAMRVATAIEAAELVEVADLVGWAAVRVGKAWAAEPEGAAKQRNSEGMARCPAGRCIRYNRIRKMLPSFYMTMRAVKHRPQPSRRKTMSSKSWGKTVAGVAPV